MLDPSLPQPKNMLLTFLDRGLLTVHEWWVLDQLVYFTAAYRAGGLLTYAGKETTKRPSRCQLCGEWSETPLLKFWLKYGGDSFWARFHPDCFKRIQKEAGL